jgi:hypothetical protein
MFAIYSRSRALSARVMHRSPNDTSCNRTHPVPPADKITARDARAASCQHLCRKPAIEFLMIANPKPHPFLARTQRNSTVVAGNSHRPRPTNRCATAPDADSDALDFLKIFRMLFGQRRARPALARGKAPRTARLRGKSRRKIARLHPWKRVWIATQPLLCLIEQAAQLWARSFVPDKPFPLRVAGQFRKQRRNVSQQFVAFGRRQCADRLFDLTRRAQQCLRYSGRHADLLAMP